MSRIQTVNGEVDPAACGMVLPHEHLFIDLRNQTAPGASEIPVTAEDHAALMHDPYAQRDNLLLDQEGTILQELTELRKLGTDTIVDCSSSQEIGRSPEKLRRLADATGLKIIAGCGNYTDDTILPEQKKWDEKTLAESMISEIRYGIGETGVRPGVIGEIGTSREITPTEKKSLRAAAIAHRETGLAVIVHIYPWCTAGLEATQILTDGGVAPQKIVICHSDVEPDTAYIGKLLKLGVWVELDNFGKEFKPEAGGFAAGKFITDAERCDLAAKIIQEGYGKQLLLTNDVCLKCMLTSCGGAGYCHVHRDILPMLVSRGIDESYLRTEICRKNPLTMIAI